MKGTTGGNGTDGNDGDKGEKGQKGGDGQKGATGATSDKGEKGQKGADSAINNNWTATLNGSTQNPATRHAAIGQYWKAGRFVFLTVRFTPFNSTGYQGDITITGVPFSSSIVAQAGYSVGTCWHDGIMINGENHADDDTIAYIKRGENTIRFITAHVPESSENQWITTDHASLIVTLTYMTDLS